MSDNLATFAERSDITSFAEYSLAPIFGVRSRRGGAVVTSPFLFFLPLPPADHPGGLVGPRRLIDGT